jgi:hypothetical protein
MDPSLLLLGTFAVVGLVGVVSGAREVFARGRLQGMRGAMYEITRGVSSHYEHEGKDIPERVAKCVDETKNMVGKAKTVQQKCEAYRINFWSLGNVMGEAAWQDGFEEGQRFTDPRDGEIRVDLTSKELVNIHWLAHYGFENMIWNKDGPFTFKDENDAERATHAIERLETNMPKQYRDEDDPYAQSFNRQTMIWDRWPSSKKPV